VHPEALAAFIQLRSLTVDDVAHVIPVADLVLAVSNLQQLTELYFGCKAGTEPIAGMEVPVGAFAALTASTSLCSLELYITRELAPQGCTLFRPGTNYPFLRAVRVFGEQKWGLTANSSWVLQKGQFISEQQLQKLCSSCPAVQELAVALCPSSQSPSSQSLAENSSAHRHHFLLPSCVRRAAGSLLSVCGWP
jgi:hypothetical protein